MVWYGLTKLIITKPYFILKHIDLIYIFHREFCRFQEQITERKIAIIVIFGN